MPMGVTNCESFLSTHFLSLLSPLWLFISHGHFPSDLSEKMNKFSNRLFAAIVLLFIVLCETGYGKYRVQLEVLLGVSLSKQLNKYSLESVVNWYACSIL